MMMPIHVYNTELDVFVVEESVSNDMGQWSLYSKGHHWNMFKAKVTITNEAKIEMCVVSPH